MKRIAALCLSALVALTAGCAYSAVAAKQEEESYDLYFREADLDAASGGDALRTERIYLSDVPGMILSSWRRRCFPSCWTARGTKRCAPPSLWEPRCFPWKWRGAGRRWICPPPMGRFPVWR